MKISTIIVLCCFSILFGCGTSTLTHKQEKSLEKEFNLTTIESGWWQSFYDPLMNKLVHDLLKQNLDIQIARIRIDEARGQAQAAGSKMFPDITVKATTVRANTNPGVNKFTRITQGGFDAAWEIDLFGKTATQLDAATQRITGKEAQFEAITASILAELMRAVISWRQGQLILNETKNLLAAQNELMKILLDRAKSGLTDSSALNKLQAEIEQTTIQISLNQADLDKATYQIQQLIGKSNVKLYTFSYKDNSLLIVPSLSQAFKNITLDCMRARPDVRASRADMLAAQAELVKVELDLWPKISIHSFFGLQTNSSKMPMINNPIWSLASDISFPLLNFGRLRGAIRVANAQAKIAAIHYEQTILNALQETKTAISDYLNGVKAVDAQEKILGHLRHNLQLSSERYSNGLTDIREVLESKIALNKAILSYVNLKANAGISYIRFFKALGTTSYFVKK